MIHTGQHTCLQVPLLSASSTFPLCFTGRIYRWSYWAGARPRFSNKCLWVLEGSRAPFQGLITPVVLLCVWQPTAAQPTNSQSTPSHTHPVRAEQACVRQSLFPILLMQSLNAVLISGIDRQVCKGNQRRACLCYRTQWPSSTMNHTMTAALLQSGRQCCEVKPTHPPTEQIHLFAFQRNEHILFSPKRILSADSTHTLPHLPDP